MSARRAALTSRWWLVGRASRSPLAPILRIEASSERKGVGSACVPRWRPPGAANGGICPKRDADPEPEARRPGDGAGYSEGEKRRRWGLVAGDDDRPSSIAEDEPPPEVAAWGMELARGGVRRSC